MNRELIGVRIGYCAAVAGLATEILDLCWSAQFNAISFLLYFVPIIAALFFVIAIWAGSAKVLRRPLLLLITFVLVTCALGLSVHLRSEIRWWLAGPIWKDRVLEQPEFSGELKHLDWDGWGMIGQETEVYLVYDPADELRNSISTPGGMHGPRLPCDVWKVQRLERDWYGVTFYTNTAWGDC